MNKKQIKHLCAYYFIVGILSIQIYDCNAKYSPKIVSYKRVSLMSVILNRLASFSSTDKQVIKDYLDNTASKLPKSLTKRDTDAVETVKDLLRHPVAVHHVDLVYEEFVTCLKVQKNYYNKLSKNTSVNQFEQIADCLYSAITLVKEKELIVFKKAQYKEGIKDGDQLEKALAKLGISPNDFYGEKHDFYGNRIIDDAIDAVETAQPQCRA